MLFIGAFIALGAGVMHVLIAVLAWWAIAKSAEQIAEDIHGSYPFHPSVSYSVGPCHSRQVRHRIAALDAE